jgi:hypothetical protein
MKHKAAALVSIAAVALVLLLLARRGEHGSVPGSGDQGQEGEGAGRPTGGAPLPSSRPSGRTPLPPSRPSAGSADRPSPRASFDSLPAEERQKILDWRERLKRGRERQQGAPGDDGPSGDVGADAQEREAEAAIERRLPATVQGELRTQVIEIWRELYRSDVQLRTLRQRGTFKAEDESAHMALMRAREEELREMLTPEEYTALTTVGGPGPDPSDDEPPR